MNLATASADLSNAAAKRLRGAAAKAERSADALAGAAATAAPQTFADLLNRFSTPAGGASPAAQPVAAPITQTAAKAGLNLAALASKAQSAPASPAEPVDAATLLADLISGAPAKAAKASGSPAASEATASPAGAKAASTSAAAPATDAAKANGVGSLAGLAALLFAGPLQTPLSTAQAAAKGERIQTALANQVRTATPTQLAAWASTLAEAGQALNAHEKQATGVDPTAPPAGWTEPANFQAARRLLASLQTTVAQAQAARGLATAQLEAPPQVQTAAAAGSPLAAGLKFEAAAPQGRATARLFGEAPPATAGGAGKSAAGAGTELFQDQVRSSAETASPKPVVRAAAAAPPAQAAAPDPKPAPADNAPSAQDMKLSPVVADAKGVERGGAKTADPAAPASGPAPGKPAAEAAAPSAPPAASAPDASAGASAAQGAQVAAAASASAPAAQPGAPASATPPQAVAYLASAIVKQANGGRSTSFNIELHPADLGRVQIKLQIESDGRLAARMAFDNPVAAADFQARADDLRRSLEQAGFQLSNDALSFSGQDAQTASGGSGGFGQSGQNASGQPNGGGSALADAQMPPAADAAPVSSQSLQAVGLDVRI